MRAFLLGIFGCLLFAGAAMSQVHSAESLECSKRADELGLSGAERKAFRSQCKANAPRPSQPPAQQTVQPAAPVNIQECSAKYQAAKVAGTLNGKLWNDFRREECNAVSQAELNPVFPRGISPVYAQEPEEQARMHTCVDQYNANKATNASGGLKWIEPTGGGYYAVCNERLKTAGASSPPPRTPAPQHAATSQLVAQTPNGGEPSANSPSGASLSYVANTEPPDAYLSLRTDPASSRGQRIMMMPNGTLVQVLKRQPDGWWYIRVVPTGETGWALSGARDKRWIECCKAASGADTSVASAVTTAASNKPSFDCAKATSASARLICSDSQLPRVDGASALLGKTVEFEFETSGLRAVDSQQSIVAPIAEVTRIRILRNAEILLFASPKEDRGVVYKINQELDVASNTNYADPKVLAIMNVSVWRTTARLSNSVLTLSYILQGVLKENGVAMFDEGLTEVAFSPDYRNCDLRRTGFKTRFPSLKVVHEQSLSRKIRCNVN